MSKLTHIWRNSFLYKVKRQNKLLFFVVVGWLVVNLLTSVFGHQTTPFYQWAMYAPPVSEKNEYSVTEVRLECGNELLSEPHTWNDYRTLMIRYQTDNYLKLTDSSYHAPDFATIKKVTSALHINISPLLKKVNPATDSYTTQKFQLWLGSYVQFLAPPSGSCISVRGVKKTAKYDELGHTHLTGETPIWSIE